jgi:hypothetical protein
MRDRNYDKKSYDQQISAMRSVIAKETVSSSPPLPLISVAERLLLHISALARSDTSISMQTWRKRDIEPKYEACRAAGPELELRYQQLEKRVKVLEESLDNAQRINKELEVDLQTAINEGIKYRDHLACMLDIREKDAKAQGNIKTAQEKENAAQGATLLASLKKAEEEVEFERSRVLNLQNEVNALVVSKHDEDSKNAAQVAKLLASLKEAEEEVEFERSRVLNLQNEVNTLESSVATKHEEGNERSVQVLLSLCHLSSICFLCNGASCLTGMGI